MATPLGKDAGPIGVGAADGAVEGAGGGHGDWPMAANGSLLVTGLEK